MKKIIILILPVFFLAACDSYKDKLYKANFKHCMVEQTEHQKGCFPRINKYPQIGQMWRVGVCGPKPGWLPESAPYNKCRDAWMMENYGVTFSQYETHICNDSETWLGGTMESHCKRIAFMDTNKLTEEEARFRLKNGWL